MKYFEKFAESNRVKSLVEENRVIDIRDEKWAHPAIRDCAIPWDSSATSGPSQALNSPDLTLEQKLENELVEAAGVNRSTYYYHFYKIEEVIEYMMESYLEKMKELSIHSDGFDMREDIERYLFGRTCEYYGMIADSKDVYSAIVNSRYRNDFYEKLVDAIEQEYRKHVHYWKPDGVEVKMDDKEKHYWDISVAYAAIGIMECWRRRKFEEEPHDVVNMIYRIYGDLNGFLLKVD